MGLWGIWEGGRYVGVARLVPCDRRPGSGLGPFLLFYSTIEKGRANRIPPINSFEMMINDVRPSNSTPLRWYYTSFIRRTPRSNGVREMSLERQFHNLGMTPHGPYHTTIRQGYTADVSHLRWVGGPVNDVTVHLHRQAVVACFILLNTRAAPYLPSTYASSEEQQRSIRALRQRLREEDVSHCEVNQPLSVVSPVQPRRAAYPMVCTATAAAR